MDYEKVYSYCRLAQEKAGIMHARLSDLGYYVSHHNPPIPRNRMALELQQAMSAHIEIADLMDRIATEIAGE